MANYRDIVAELEDELAKLKTEVNQKKLERRAHLLEDGRRKERIAREPIVGVPIDALRLLQSEEYLKTRFKQTSLSLTFLEDEEKLLREKIERINATLERDKRIEESLRQKITEQAERADRTPKDPESATMFLMEKSKRVNSYFRKISLLMKNFISQHFPQPDADTVRKVERLTSAYDALRIENNFNLKSCKDIIEILVNRHLDSPHDPYVSVDETFWVPYVEMLISYGVASRNPDNSYEIRLASFD